MRKTRARTKTKMQLSGKRPIAEISITELPEKAKRYAQLVTEDGPLTNPVELQKIEERIVLVFVMDKRSRKICRFTNDTCIQSLTTLRVKTQKS